MDARSKQQHFERAEELLAQQNFTAALIIGAFTAVLAGAAYGIVTSRAGFAYGFAAAGVGVVVGSSMQFLGHGVETKFQVAASVLTIVGCLLGNVFRAAVSLGPRDVTMSLNAFRDYPLSDIVRQSLSYLSFVDLIFWFVAVFAAAFLARRALSRADRLALGLYQLER